MSREILFRGKRVDTGEWAYGCYVNCSGPGCQPYETRHYIMEYPDKWREVYTATVGQYTGLKDRNGKRIFEGDIVEFPNMRGKHRFRIRWSDEIGSYYVEHIGEQLQWSPCCNLGTMATCTITGNIHDKHELLNSEGTTRNGGEPTHGTM